jgi:phage replication O-like protein O
MSNPQLENGYTSIANELAEQLAKTQLSGYESRYLWVLWRLTYGWHKKEDRIANSQFVEKTGLKKQHIWRTESNLIKRNIVTKIGYKICFNKHYSQWIELEKLPKKVTVTNSGIKVTKNASKVTKNGAYKRNPTKETIQKKHSGGGNTFLKGEEWNQLIDSFADVNPMYLDFYKLPHQRKALDELAKSIGFEKLKNTIIALKDITSKPYAPKITSPTELKRDLGKLIAFYNQEKNKEIVGSKFNKPNYIL